MKTAFFIVCFFFSTLSIASLHSDVITSADEPFSTPDFLDLSDFSLSSSGSIPEGVRGELISGSLEWVRVRRNIAIPRARLHVEVQGAESGNAEVAKVFSPFTVKDGKAVVEILIPLVPGNRNPFKFSFVRKQKVESFDLKLVFTPKTKRNRIFIDSTCSKSGVSQTADSNVETWVYIGCDSKSVLSEETRTAQLSLNIFWAGAGDYVAFEGQNVANSEPSLWQFNLSSKPGKVKFLAGSSTLTLDYFIAEKVNRGRLGLGLGPYRYNFTGGGEDIKSIVAIPTLYGSYAVNDKYRVVFFDIFSYSKNISTLFGLYWNFNYEKFLDNRISFNIMIGITSTAFTAGGKWHFNPDFPQGVEFIFSDFLGKGKSLAVGGFIRPMLNDSYSYNTWARWGGKWFVELNYISWQWKDANQLYISDSLGLTVGTSLFGFL